jgi:hypothetical protein
LKAVILSLIFCCKPKPVPKAKIIMMMPILMAVTAIFIIGEETLLL